MRVIGRLAKVTLLVLALLAAWSVVRAGSRSTAFRRQIIVNVPAQTAWAHFGRPTKWVSWLGESGAPTAVGPSDELGPATAATFAGGFEFHMKEFEPYRHWMWSASFGPMTIDYDHVFERLGERQTRMVFHQTVTGFGNDVLATLLGVLTSVGGHQAALDRLAAEINQLPEASR